MSRRRNLVVVLLAILALLTWYVVYTQQVVRELRKTADIQGEMYAVISRAAQDTDTDPVAVFLKLQGLMRSSGVPFVLTNAADVVAASENVDSAIVKDSARMKQFIRELDARLAGWYARQAAHRRWSVRFG